MVKVNKKSMETDLNPGIDHPVLQVIACTLGDFTYDDIRYIYDSFKLRLTTIEINLRFWFDEDLLRGYNLSIHTGPYSKAHINPKRLAEVLQTIKPEKFDKLQSYGSVLGSDDNKALCRLAKTFYNFLHGRPFIDDMEKVNWQEMADDINISQLIIALCDDSEYVDYTQHITPEILNAVFLKCHVLKSWVKLEPVEDMKLINGLFLKNPYLNEPLRQSMNATYLYYIEFLHTGKLYETLEKMSPDTFHYKVLSAIKSLHEVNADESFLTLNNLLKHYKIDYFEDPLSNFAYAISMGLSELPSAKKEAMKLVKKHYIDHNSECYAMQIALNYYVKSSVSDYFMQNPLSFCRNDMARYLTVFFMQHYSLLEKDSSVAREIEKKVLDSEFNYLKRLYADDFPVIGRQKDVWKEKTGLTTSIVPKVRKFEKWEHVIKHLNILYEPSSAKTKKKAEIKRIVYYVDTSFFRVTPILQKSNDGGVTWDKGREISLKTYKSGDEDYYTDLDRRLAGMIRSFRSEWQGGAIYSLEGEKAIAALVGCPNVFLSGTGTHLDIVSEPVQLSVLPVNEGYRITANVDVTIPGQNKNTRVTSNNDKVLTVVTMNTLQKKTLEVFAECDTFPKESEEQLTQLLQKLSENFTILSPLLKNMDNMKTIETSSQTVVQISPSKEGFYWVSPTVKPFGDFPVYQKPGKGAEVLSTTIDGVKTQTKRDLEAEKQNLEVITDILNSIRHKYSIDEEVWYLDTSECLRLLDSLRSVTDVAYVEWPQGAKMKVSRPMITPDRLQLEIRSIGQWFEVDGEVNIDEKEKIKVTELLERLKKAEGRFIRLSDDEYIALSASLFKQLQVLDNMNAGNGKKLKLAAINGLLLADLEDMGAKMKSDEAFNTLMTRIREADRMQFEIPKNIHAELRPYQHEGFVWMSRLAWWGAGACLADDMGLGKTLQSITLMQSRVSEGAQLVIMPTSLLRNWEAELKRFAPAINVQALNEAGVNRETVINEAGPGDVVLATYGLLVTEDNLLTSRTWTTIILDEAHTIKNRGTQTSKNAMNLKGDFRLLLTGTPIQNHLGEIWNLFQFATPGLLGSFQQFSERFILPIERDHNLSRQEQLRRLLLPFLLRRTKEDVLSELPRKTEIVMNVELSAEEKALYDNLRQQALDNLDGKSNSLMQALAEITRLRQAACHPQLINPELKIPSSKSAVFLELVDDIINGGHRALVFSQFTSHLALIRKELERLGIRYLYLDGNTSPHIRSYLVRSFQTNDTPLFLISLKAGGLGLNLTAADFVIHLDPWWNPAIEDQASDRAYRIGQERPVTVYRLISSGTVEEKIIRLHHEKRSLADALLEDTDLNTKISAEDIINLLKEDIE